MSLVRRLVRPVVIAVVVVPVLAVAGTHVVDIAGHAGGTGAPVGGVAALIVARGHGWAPQALFGPVPAAGSCHFRTGAHGAVLPDPGCTPGAVDPLVTQANLRSTVCRAGGYTTSVRPPQALTEPVKRKLMAAYGIPWTMASHYELDHLIELSAGGASDVRNLWPEPNTFLAGTATKSGYVHNDKDQVEGYTFHKICTAAVSLGRLQQAMARDWSTAVAVLGLPPIPKGYVP